MKNKMEFYNEEERELLESIENDEWQSTGKIEEVEDVFDLAINKYRKKEKQIHAFVRTFLPKNEKKQPKVKPYISFEEWNEQFADNQNLNEFIPEYGTTLKEFRQGIYEAETNEKGDMTFEELKESIKTW